MKDHVELLDSLIPLRGASHANVVEYSAVTPMRYTECRARLADGRVVSLAQPCQFSGWSIEDGALILLMTSDDQHVELRVSLSGTHHVESVTIWRVSNRKPNGNASYFVARDGSRFALELAELLSVSTLEEQPLHREPDPLDPYPEWLACRNRAESDATR